MPQDQLDRLKAPLQFGRWKLTNPLLLAPLEAVTDCAFRRLCAELGAGFTWTEMIRTDALAQGDEATYDLIDTHDVNTPTGLQLLGMKPAILRRALANLERAAAESRPHFLRGIHGVDLNFGCPSVDVIKQGAGPALLNRPDEMEAIFDVLAEWRASTKLPIGVIGAKIRLGLKGAEERRGVFLKVIELAKERLDYVTVHGRNAKDGSRTPARWRRIRQAKEVAGNELLVIGNGDVFSRADAAAMLAETGCDGVLVARGAIQTSGFIFNPAWKDDKESLLAAVPELADRYFAYLKRYRSHRQRDFYAPEAKFQRYHWLNYRRIPEIFSDTPVPAGAARPPRAMSGRRSESR